MMSATFILLVLLACYDRLLPFLVAVDQVANTMIGSGYPDETLSAFAHRRQGWRRTVINGLFFWQTDHCAEAFASELKRRHLPREYRQKYC